MPVPFLFWTFWDQLSEWGDRYIFWFWRRGRRRRSRCDFVCDRTSCRISCRGCVTWCGVYRTKGYLFPELVNNYHKLLINIINNQNPQHCFNHPLPSPLLPLLFLQSQKLLHYLCGSLLLQWGGRVINLLIIESILLWVKVYSIRWYWSATVRWESHRSCADSRTIPSNKAISPPLVLILSSSTSNKNVELWNLMTKLSNCRFGTPLGRRDSGPSPVLTIKMLRLLCWYLIWRSGRPLRTFRNFGWTRLKNIQRRRCRLLS